jgi:hypothetical protein
MEKYCKQNLDELKNLLIALNNEQYAKPSQLLSGATIGQHIRHILEFYLCLMKGVFEGSVNYDKRERNLEIESNKDFSIYTIEKIKSNLTGLKAVKETISLNGNFSENDDSEIKINTSFQRELAYCLEHSIHHQALIKIGLIEQKIENLIPQNFGIAPASIRHKEKCAQ